MAGAGPSTSVTSVGALIGPVGHRSLSSSEEELRSTPEYTSGDELDPRHARRMQTTAYLHSVGDMGMGGMGGMSSLSKGAYDGAKTSSGSVMGGGPGNLLPAGAGVLPKYHRYHHMAPPERRKGYTDRGQKKTVRFDSDDFGGEGGGADEEWFWDQGSAERQGSQDSTTKDSGIDTCSNFTSSEDSNRELVHTKVNTNLLSLQPPSQVYEFFYSN